MKDDTISRAAAVTALNGLTEIYLNNLPPTIYKSDAVDAIKALPSATDTNVGGDLIDRQAAIDTVRKAKDKSEAHRMLVQLPPAQPGCEDAVSRADVDILIEEAQTAWLRGDILLMYPTLKKGLQKVPSVTPKQPGWIPWDSGRFPEESGTYTVTAYDGATKRVTYAKYQKRLKRWELTGARAYWRVLAWMPHIEPWEGGQDE